jgi:hypothetical protein
MTVRKAGKDIFLKERIKILVYGRRKRSEENSI